ncbi:hypothetical protein [Burkholderia sp. Ac-20344]|uniref:hypothetical protein n=1 Tax=Burkholderia sp. Ac-20344 TaxID=2703890 RepID=UPI00197B75AE|nr:hypothetical protein [Burkholderia sp. Ac-20344]MBN3834583.1 hypothetical protein [Burkholderia sp. Ac-20344]
MDRAESNFRSVVGILKSKIALAIIFCSTAVSFLSACSMHEMIYGLDPSKITPIDATLTGNMANDVSIFYGTYRLLSGSLGRGVVALEVTPSQYGKPIFSFINDKGIPLIRNSPPSCKIDKGAASLVGSIRCGEITFFQTNAFFSLNSAVHSKNDAPGTYSGIVDYKIVEFKPNWYTFDVRWPGQRPESRSALLEKVK